MTREEYIDFANALKNNYTIDFDKLPEFCDMAISALSENKGEDRPKGHWIESGYVGNDNYLFKCSECHHTDTQSKAVRVNYCWFCGADMRGE